jgi:phospho-N-acetylmuramoyl-pentapeptide-transferase
MTFALSMGVITCLLTIIWGSPLIEVLKYFRLGKQIRTTGLVADRHLKKEGTPTFGGVLVIVPAILSALLVNVVNVIRGTAQGRSILVPLVGLILFGVLGAVDDWEGLKGKRGKGEGISEMAKLSAQIVIASVIALVLFFLLDTHSVVIPTVPFKIDLGYWYLPIAVFIILSTSNGCNLADGLDGLAGNVMAVAFGAYGTISFLQGQTWLATFDFIMLGCLFGFIWYNAHPAKVFMGDTGSMAIGSTLGVVALMSGQWLLLPVIAFILVIMVGSAILQISFAWYSKKFLGEKKRLFKAAPIHHHFELIGWGEVQIVLRFWLISILSGMIGIALALL